MFLYIFDMVHPHMVSSNMVNKMPPRTVIVKLDSNHISPNIDRRVFTSHGLIIFCKEIGLSCDLLS